VDVERELRGSVRLGGAVELPDRIVPADQAEVGGSERHVRVRAGGTRPRLARRNAAAEAASPAARVRLDLAGRDVYACAAADEHGAGRAPARRICS
jgi:hypothetical protein